MPNLTYHRALIIAISAQNLPAGRQPFSLGLARYIVEIERPAGKIRVSIFDLNGSLLHEPVTITDE